MSLRHICFAPMVLPTEARWQSPAQLRLAYNSMLDIQNEFHGSQGQGVCGIIIRDPFCAFFRFGERLLHPQSQLTGDSQSHCPLSPFLVRSSVLPGGPPGWPGTIYLHSEFIRNHQASLATAGSMLTYLESRHRYLYVAVPLPTTPPLGPHPGSTPFGHRWRMPSVSHPHPFTHQRAMDASVRANS